MEKLILLSFILINLPIHIYSQWISYTISPNFDLFDLSAPDTNTCYVCGYGNSLFKTTNGGTNWINLSFPTTAQNLTAIHFFNANTGIMSSTNNLLYRTTNGGFNWDTVINLGVQAEEIFFINGQTGYIPANNSIKITTNAGLNWSSINTPSFNGIFFKDINTGWGITYLGAGASSEHKTTNGGINWVQQFSIGDFKILYSIFFVNENTGYMSGYRHTIFKTTNGGDNWSEQNYLTSAGGLYSIAFINENTGWIVGDNSGTTNTYYTTNGGVNWIASNSIQSGGRVTKIKFIKNTNRGWVVGQYGKVWKTTNTGGLTSISENKSISPQFELSQNYPNPFNPVTKISYAIPEQSMVTIKIYDIRGREISVLVNDIKQPGYHTIDYDGSGLTSGIYFYKIEAGTFKDVKKLMLIK